MIGIIGYIKNYDSFEKQDADLVWPINRREAKGKEKKWWMIHTSRDIDNDINIKEIGNQRQYRKWCNEFSEETDEF